MNNEEFEKNIMSRLKRPFPAASEMFVQGVMDEIEGEAAALERPSSFVFRWLVPGFSLGLASLLFLLTFIEPAPMVATEDLLYSNGQAADDASLTSLFDI